MSAASERGLTKTEYMATIYDGHSHIERRVFKDGCGEEFVRINGFFVETHFLRSHMKYDVDVWYDG